MAKKISFKVTDAEAVLIEKIVQRAMDYGMTNDPQAVDMNLRAVHANGCPLDFQKLLKAPLFDFGHDLTGIARHLDRTTGELKMCFLPRTAKGKTK